jgi:hypothetical protein
MGLFNVKQLDMRSLAKFTRLLPILFILLMACQPEEEKFLEVDPDIQEVENFIADAEEMFLDPSARIATDITPCGDPIEVPLKAFHNNVGNLYIVNTEDHLVVEYATNSGYILHKTMLVVMIEKQNPGNSKWKYAKYRKIILPVNHNKEDIDKYVYEIPYSKLDLTGNECVTIIGISKLKATNNPKNNRSIYALAKQSDNYSKSIFKRYFIEYCLQACENDTNPDDGSCEIDCTYGFGVPSVDVSKSFSFEELGLSDWPWGYAYEISKETLVRLPVKSTDSETAPVVGQVTLMIEDDLVYVYYKMNDNFSLSKTKLYVSADAPVSGLPCNYNYEREYRNPDGTLMSTMTDIYELGELDQIQGTNGKFWIIAYVDFCE